MIGRTVQYIPVPHQAAIDSMIAMGVPQWIAEGYGELDDGFEQGFADLTTSNVHALSGHEPRGFEQFARDYRRGLRASPGAYVIITSVYVQPEEVFVMTTSPIDAVVAIHNAFRADMAAIDAAALAAARGTPGLEATVERFRFFNEVLEWHAHGEELAVFPALEEVAPLVAEAYEMDHRGLDRRVRRA